MELNKLSEVYELKDLLENGWQVTGNVSHDVKGSISFWANVASEEGQSIGNVHFSKPLEGNISVSYDMEESNREFLAGYSDKVVDFVMEQLNA